MQDAKALGAMKSADLQQKPVDFHINAAPNNTDEFYAYGRYLNDDGIVLNNTGKHNNYSITFNLDKDGSGSLVFEKTSSATELEKERVNLNDAINKLVWHNAANTNLGQNMALSVTVEG